MISTTTTLITALAITPRVVSVKILLGTIQKIATTLAVFVSQRSSAAPTVQPVYHRIDEFNFGFKLALVEALVQELDDKTEEEGKDRTEIAVPVLSSVSPQQQPKTLQIILGHLHSILDRIHQCLSDIQRLHAEHESKWFSAWRTFDCQPQLIQLQTAKQQLDEGFELLVKVLPCIQNNGNKVND
jgi:hypothetical protein